MDLEKIEGLVKIIEDSSLNEFTYKDKDVKITMSKLDHPPVVATGVPVAASAPVNTIVEKAEEEEEESLFITSPIVGTFYSAAAPDVPAFVKVGDLVKAGQTVCILEALKLSYFFIIYFFPTVGSFHVRSYLAACIRGSEV